MFEPVVDHSGGYEPSHSSEQVPQGSPCTSSYLGVLVLMCNNHQLTTNSSCLLIIT